MPRDKWISANPCAKCGGTVEVTEVNEDHGDVRWNCLMCGAVGYEEGPDA